MAMNKAERARVAALEEALRLAPYMVAQHLQQPEPMAPGELDTAKRAGLTYLRGWKVFELCDPPKVEPYSTNSVCHWPGHGPYRAGCGASQRMGVLYRTEREAWTMVAILLRDRYAKTMAGVMDKLEASP